MLTCCVADFFTLERVHFPGPDATDEYRTVKEGLLVLLGCRSPRSAAALLRTIAGWRAAADFMAPMAVVFGGSCCKCHMLLDYAAVAGCDPRSHQLAAEDLYCVLCKGTGVGEGFGLRLMPAMFFLKIADRLQIDQDLRTWAQKSLLYEVSTEV